MKPSKLKKSIVLVFIAVSVLGFGFVLFIYPNIEALQNAYKLLSEKNEQISQALLVLEEIEQLDTLYTDAVKKAILTQENFYPEMTTVEAVREVQRILNEAFNGQEQTNYTETGIQISPLSATTLAVYRLPINSDVDYDIRQYSFLQRDNQEESDTSEITLKEAFEFIHNKNITSEERKYLLHVIRELLIGESVEVGVINASFTLKLTYNEYLYFMDYICMLPKAASFSSITFKSDSALESETREDYHFSLDFYVIKEMEIN